MKSDAAEEDTVPIDEPNPMLDKIVKAIVDLSARKGYPPTVREIGAKVGLSSPSTVHVYLKRLQRQGRIRQDPTKPRTITVVR